MGHSTATKRTLHQNTFPSDDFMGKYYSPDSDPYITKSLPQEGLHMYHNMLRDIFVKCLYDAPRHYIRIADRKMNGFEKIHVFVDSICSDCVSKLLKGHEMSPELTPEVQKELCTEFIAQYEIGVFHQDPWWKWVVSEDSVWIEITPDANPMGGNRPKRTLAELFTKK